MTREEAIKIIERVDICANAAETARDMAIAALREPILVRCKNCVHMKKQFGARYCEVWTMFNGMGDDGFCNYGERKDNG